MSDEIRYSINSLVDEFGRVFFVKNKVYRAISNEYIYQCKELLEEPFFIELMEAGLIPRTTVSDYKLSKYDLILEHEKLLNTLQYEWSFSMLKNAALTILKIQNICAKYGFELKDAHSMNILFRGNQAVYVDIGSFRKKTNETNAILKEFISCFYIPLSLWASGKFYLARKILESNSYSMRTIPVQEVINPDIINLLKYKPVIYNGAIRGRHIVSTNTYSNFLNKISKVFNKIVSILRGRKSSIMYYGMEYKGMEQIEEDILGMEYPESNTLWKNYHSKLYDDKVLLPSSPRFNRILEIFEGIIEKENISSVLDLAGNSGLMSFLIEDKFKIPTIILSDYDEMALEYAYMKQIERKTSIDMVLLNFMLTPNIEDTAKRLKSDIVLALAITHHLILTSKFILSSIFERVKLYSNKYVFIEFMPMGLYSADYENVIPDIPSWYNLEWFRNEFENHFILLNEEKLEKNRILFIGKLKKFIND